MDSGAPAVRYSRLAPEGSVAQAVSYIRLGCYRMGAQPKALGLQSITNSNSSADNDNSYKDSDSVHCSKCKSIGQSKSDTVIIS